MMSILGTFAPEFADVVEAFGRTFAGRPEMGAALCVYSHGKVVVDVSGGYADSRDSSPWTPSTPTVIFSCTKGLTSLLAAMLVEQARLDYDAPVARYWPEFAQAGKGAILVRHVLAHQAGLSAPTQDLSLTEVLDWHCITSKLAEQKQLWPLGFGHVYHTLTHGWLVGEVIRRVTNRSVGDYFAEAIAKPLGAEAWIGLPRDGGPVAYLRLAPSIDRQASGDDDPLIERAATMGGAIPRTLIESGRGFNDPAVHRAEVPGAGGIATANALAAIWSSTVVETKGVRLLSPKTIAAATKVQSEGPWVLRHPGPYQRWGMGFELTSPAAPFIPEGGFGHGGYGGQVAFADPKHKLGFAYLTNWLEGAGDTRFLMVIDALRRVTNQEALAR